MIESYPIVTNIVPSTQNASILKTLLFSKAGFLSNFLSYSYQNWNFEKIEKPLSDYVGNLAKTNNEILNTLGKMTIAFGGNPNFETSNERNWSTQFILDCKNKNSFLSEAIKMENNAIKSLYWAIDKVDNNSLKDLLNVFVLDKENIIKDLLTF